MSSRLTPRGAVTRDKILSTATELVRNEGIAGFTVDEVCAKAHVSKSQLYHYFETRDVLVEAVASTTVEEVLDLQSELFASLDTIDGLRRWATALVDLQIERESRGGCPIGTLVGQTPQRQTPLHGILREGLDRWTAAIEAGFTAMKDRGEFPATFDPVREARLFMVAVQGGLLLTDAHYDYTWLRLALDERLTALESMLIAP